MKLADVKCIEIYGIHVNNIISSLYAKKNGIPIRFYVINTEFKQVLDKGYKIDFPDI